MIIICPKCKKEFEQKLNNKFCSRKCANSHVQTFAQNEARSKKLSRSKAEDRFCLTCKKIIPSTNKSGHCNTCVKLTEEYRKNMSKAVRGKVGGLRQGAGRGKKGWYKGYFCDSTWELVFVIYCIDNNIKITRNNQGFDYIFNNQNHKFYPDFISENNTYIEVKGRQDAQYRAKQESFPFELATIGKAEIKKFMEYVSVNYTNKFESLYEDYEPKYKYICLFCQKEFESSRSKGTYCSRSCAGKHRSHLKHSKKLS